jgi:hypothetical protein
MSRTIFRDNLACAQDAENDAETWPIARKMLVLVMSQH